VSCQTSAVFVLHSLKGRSYIVSKFSLNLTKRNQIAPKDKVQISNEICSVWWLFMSMVWDYLPELRPPMGLLLSPRCIWVWTLAELYWQGNAEESEEKLATVSTTNPTWNDRGANLVLTVRGRRLTAWAMARCPGVVTTVQIYMTRLIDGLDFIFPETILKTRGEIVTSASFKLAFSFV
jgi:hypothetical protein